MSETIAAQINTVLTLLRRLPPRARLRVVAQIKPEAERELEMSATSPASVEWDEVTLAAAEARLQQQLVEMGLLAEIKEPLPPSERKLPALIEVPGMPLSEIIIAERR